MKWLIAVAVLSVSGSVLAQGAAAMNRQLPYRGGALGNPGSDAVVRMVTNPRLAERIGLSPEQIASIKAIGDEQRKFERDNRDRVRQATMKQMELMKAEKIDEAAVMAAIDELFEIRKEITKRQVQRVIKIRALLTPEQIAKAQAENERVVKERRLKQRGPKPEKENKPEVNPEAGNPPPPPPKDPPKDA